MSLLKHSIYGTFNTVSKLTGTVGKGLAALSFDDEYIRKRQLKQISEKPKHAGEGVLYGFKELGEGIFGGVSGIVMQPYKGAEKEGPKGFVKGIGKGIVGYDTH